MAALTRVGLGGPMTAYGVFAAKTEAVDTAFVGCALMLTGCGYLWWVLVLLRGR